MKRIVYYISDNGFGHAARGIALIRELAKYDDIEIIIKTGQPLEFIYSENDVGLILKNNSLKVDKLTLQKSLKEWVDSWEELIENEGSFLRAREVDLVISDITPWAFLVAERVGVKSIALSNFTWYEIYQDLLGDNAIIEKIGEAYKKVGIFFQLPLNLDITASNNLTKVGFVSRQIDNQQVKDIKQRIGTDKKLIYVGIGKSVDSGLLTELEFEKEADYNWLFSSGIELEEDNIYTIPKSATQTQNYITACDYVITKPGWTTVTESIMGRVPLLMIERDEVIEDRTVIEKVSQLGLGLSIAEEEFINLNIVDKLEQLDKLRGNFVQYENEVEKIVKEIYECGCV
jgi:uncharacterized protein (TIGR00661 family)